MGWYDRKLGRVHDLSCGDTRVYLELEVRRLNCRACGKVKPSNSGDVPADVEKGRAALLALSL